MSVSEENMQKVENYIVTRVKENGTDRFQATVLEIAEGSGVALATAHNAIKQLDSLHTIQVIKYPSRRVPNMYVYLKEIEGFRTAQSKDEQIAYLTNLVRELNDKNSELLALCHEVRGENRVLQNRIRELEA